jgi:hypothetical protein
MATASAKKTIGNNAFITDNEIRTFLRDTDPDANLLLDDFEFTPEEIRDARNSIVDKWNETPPPVGIYQYDTFPYRYYYRVGVCALLMWTAANRYRRNDLQYNIGGGAVADQNKAESYDKAGNKLMDMFDAWMKQEKLRRNMEDGFGQDTGRYY